MVRLIFALLLAFGLVSSASGQSDESASPIQVLPPIPRDQILLPTVDPDTPDTEQWTRFIDQVWVRNVSKPSLYRVPPKLGRSNGRAVIVVPGGGYSFVSIEPEGFWVAEGLAAQGYTAFVLKYRPRTTPASAEGFKRQVLAEFAGYTEEVDADHPPAVDDLAAAISLVRGRADELQVDADKIGVIGFSAGALSAIRLLEHHEEASALHNVALIYPPSSDDMEVKVRPDLFMAIGTGDFLFHRGSMDWVWDWHAAGGKVDFHLYSDGSHGFGMRPQGDTSDLWFDQYLAWLETRG